MSIQAATDIGVSQDEARRKLLKPKVTLDEALSILIDLYVDDGFDAEAKVPRVEVVKELDSYDDVNFLVKIEGEEALLKIHNGVESEQYIAARSRKRAKLSDEAASPSAPSDGDDDGSGGTSIIDLQTAIFKHLEASKYDVTTGRTISPKNTVFNRHENDGGNSSVCIRELAVVSPTHSPQHLAVRLQTWVAGTPLSALQWFPLETLVDAGACLGRMCCALDDLAASDPNALRASQHYHAWDGRNLMDSMPYVAHIDDAGRRDLVTSVLDAFQRTIIEGKEGEKFRVGINHGDFNDANIIIGYDMKVSGVIDFGDTVSR